MKHLYFLLLLLAAPLSAQPYVYWANLHSNSIGRAGLDGTGVNATFIIGAGNTYGVAIDGNYIYWASDYDAIGRANLDGTGVNRDFIPGVGPSHAIAVDGDYIYWATGIGTIGRANLDGTDANTSFIHGPDAFGLVVSDPYIYWTNMSSNTIGRANLDGSDARQNFIVHAGIGSPTGLAVGGGYIYWTNSDTNTIGRASLDGTDVNASFIPEAYFPYGVTTDGSYLYWSNSDYDAIGRANLDGSDVKQNFITGAGMPFGLVTTNSGSLPVELTSFTATLDGTDALLRWTTASETNNAGFDVEQRQNGSFRTLGFVAGRGTTAEATNYRHSVEGLTPGTHTFRLKQVDFDGAFAYSPEVELTIHATGASLALFGVPARDAIRGTLSLPQGEGRLTLFDALGREVAREEGVAGAFTLDVSGLPSGAYVLRAEAGAQAITRQVVVAR